MAQRENAAIHPLLSCVKKRVSAKKMNKTICVTGGTGFVGHGVVPALLKAGFGVHALVRNGSEGKLAMHDDLTIFTGDVRDSGAIENALIGCEALVHLVGIRRHEMKRTGLTYEDVDLGSVQAAIIAMKAANVRRIVLLSAASIGNSVYIQTKKRAEQAVMAAGLDWTLLKPCFILGKGQRWPIILSPILNLFALLPGHFGDMFKRARNVARGQLANAIVWALGDEAAIGQVLDVSEIRKM
jgi:NADH dehydrogenase